MVIMAYCDFHSNYVLQNTKTVTYKAYFSIKKMLNATEI